MCGASYVKLTTLLVLIVISFSTRGDLEQRRLQCRAVNIVKRSLKGTDINSELLPAIMERLSKQAIACEEVKTLQDKLVQLSSKIKGISKMLAE